MVAEKEQCWVGSLSRRGGVLLFGMQDCPLIICQWYLLQPWPTVTAKGITVVQLQVPGLQAFLSHPCCAHSTQWMVGGGWMGSFMSLWCAALC